MYSQEWLEDNTAIRGIFIEAHVDVNGIDNVKYFSTIGYITNTADVHFNPVIVGNVTYTESMSIDNTLSMSFGDIELHNRNGELDSWLNSTTHVWINKPITIYFGDPRWATANITEFRSIFKPVYTGLITDIDSREVSSINIRMKDKLDLLNTPITEHLIGPGTAVATNEFVPIPLVFGEVYNIPVVLLNKTTTLDYFYSDGECEGLIELRDNGIPIYTRDSLTYTGATPGTKTVNSLTCSGFTKNTSVAGTLTVSCQGIKGSINLTTLAKTDVYLNNITNVILLLVTTYGINHLTISSIDMTNMATFASLNDVPVGVYIKDNSNLLQVCKDILASIGATLYFNRLGKLQLIKLGQSTSVLSHVVEEYNMLANTFSIVQKVPVKAAAKIGYCKNWQVQTGLTTNIDSANKLDFETEYVYASNSDSTSASKYGLSTEVPSAINTYLIRTQDAIAEAERRVDYFKDPRIVYKFTGTSSLLSLELGEFITLKHTRFGLHMGKSAQVISLSPNWSNSTVEVEVIV